MARIYNGLLVWKGMEPRNKEMGWLNEFPWGGRFILLPRFEARTTPTLQERNKGIPGSKEGSRGNSEGTKENPVYIGGDINGFTCLEWRRTRPN